MAGKSFDTSLITLLTSGLSGDQSKSHLKIKRKIY